MEFESSIIRSDTLIQSSIIRSDTLSITQPTYVVKTLLSFFYIVNLHMKIFHLY